MKLRAWYLSLIVGCLASVLTYGADLKIVGTTKVAPYTLVRLKAEGLPDKAGYRWYITAVSPSGSKDTARQALIDWPTNQGPKSKSPEFVAPPGDYSVALRVIKIVDGVPDWDETETVVTILPPGPVPPGPIPPGPGPIPPNPTPDPPAPIPAAGLRVLIIYETGDNLTAGQRSILYGAKARDYLRSHCVKDDRNPDGAFRIWDQNQNPAGDPDETQWRPAMQRARTSLPWVIISNGKTGYEGPLPADITADSFIALLSKYEK